MFLIPLGMLRGADVSVKSFLLNNLLPVTLGNTIAGAAAVAGMYSAAYGSNQLGLKKKTDSLLGMRGGFIAPSTAAATASFSSSVSGTKLEMSKKSIDFLPAETLERAKAGNMFEKVKLKNDPTNVWDEITEFAAAIRSGKINWQDIASDDMDIRVKYAGMFHRKKATPGKFMMRLRVPNGIVNSEQMRYFAVAVKPYGPEIGVVDVTTRANIQLRGMPMEDGADILKNLQAVGLTSVMSGLDNLRNMVGSPIAGIDPLELFDTRALTKQIDDWYTGCGKGNAEWCNMPRKFNIAISGSRGAFCSARHEKKLIHRNLYMSHVLSPLRTPSLYLLPSPSLVVSSSYPHYILSYYPSLTLSPFYLFAFTTITVLNL